METHTPENITEEEKSQKIQSLREMISNAEKTIQSAKAMLLQFEGKKRVGRKRKLEDEDGEIIQGIFDGQIMMGNNGKQYPVPPNYASKSKLIEGDLLKLTITDAGSFIYKQIGPIERKHLLGIVAQDETGGYFVIAENRPYRVLLASVTYFQAEPGDEVAIVCPRDIDSNWASIENIVQKAKFSSADPMVKVTSEQKAETMLTTNTTSELLKEDTLFRKSPSEEIKTEETTGISSPNSATPQQHDAAENSPKPDTLAMGSAMIQEDLEEETSSQESTSLIEPAKDDLLDISDFDVEKTASKEDAVARNSSFDATAHTKEDYSEENPESLPQPDTLSESKTPEAVAQKSTPLLSRKTPKLLENTPEEHTPVAPATDRHTPNSNQENSSDTVQTDSSENERKEETLSLLNEWQADIEEIEKEMGKSTQNQKEPASQSEKSS